MVGSTFSGIGTFTLCYEICSGRTKPKRLEDKPRILPDPKERQRMSEFQTLPGAVRQNVKKEKTKREKRLDFFEKYHIMVIVLLLTTMK